MKTETIRTRVSELDHEVLEYIKDKIRYIFDAFLPESPNRKLAREAASAIKNGDLKGLEDAVGKMRKQLHDDNSLAAEHAQGAMDALQDNKIPEVVVPEDDKPLDL
jgi:hypothetical protein